MEIARVNTARAIRLFSLEELNPQGRDLMPLVGGIRQRYRFVRGPAKEEEFDLGRGVRFYTGNFRSRDIDISVDLEIYNDGVVVNTRSNTFDADALIDDLLSWARKTYGVGNEDYIPKSKRIYRSELVVFAPKVHLDRVFGKLSQFIGSISAEADDAMQPTGFSFGSDSPKNRLMFTFERELKAPFEEDKYYTTSLLPTDKHLEVLHRLEELFGE